MLYPYLWNRYVDRCGSYFRFIARFEYAIIYLAFAYEFFDNIFIYLAQL